MHAEPGMRSAPRYRVAVQAPSPHSPRRPWGESTTTSDLGAGHQIWRVRLHRGSDPGLLRLPSVSLAAGRTSQRNGNSRKAAQEDPLALEPGWNRRTGTGTLNHNVSHRHLLLIIKALLVDGHPQRAARFAIVALQESRRF